MLPFANFHQILGILSFVNGRRVLFVTTKLLEVKVWNSILDQESCVDSGSIWLDEDGNICTKMHAAKNRKLGNIF